MGMLCSPPATRMQLPRGYFCSGRALAPPAAMAGCPGEAAGWDPGGLALGCAFWAVILVTGVARGELKAGFGWEIPGVSLLGLGPETKPAFMADFPRQDFALGLWLPGSARGLSALSHRVESIAWW